MILKNSLDWHPTYSELRILPIVAVKAGGVETNVMSLDLTA
jgi:hypothetical protein